MCIVYSFPFQQLHIITLLSVIQRRSCCRKLKSCFFLHVTFFSSASKQQAPDAQAPPETALPIDDVAQSQTNSGDEDEVEIIKQICGRPTRSGRLPRPAIKSTEDEDSLSASLSPSRTTKMSPARPPAAGSSSKSVGGLVSPLATASSNAATFVGMSPVASRSTAARAQGSPAPRMLSTPRPIIAGVPPSPGFSRMTSPLASGAAAAGGVLSPAMLGVDRLPSGVYVVLESPQSSAAGGESLEGHHQVLYHIFAEMSPASTPPPQSPHATNAAASAVNPGPAIRPLHTAAHAFSGPRNVLHSSPVGASLHHNVGSAVNVRTAGSALGVHAPGLGLRSSPGVVVARPSHVFAYPGAPPVHAVARPVAVTSAVNMPIIPSLQFQPLTCQPSAANRTLKSPPSSLVNCRPLFAAQQAKANPRVAEDTAHLLPVGECGMTPNKIKPDAESSDLVTIATKQQDDGTVVIMAEPSNQHHSASTNCRQSLQATPVVGSEAANSAPTIRVIEHADGSTELLIDGNLGSAEEPGDDDDSQYIDVVVEHYPFNDSVLT
jgi:hypothetical protein